MVVVYVSWYTLACDPSVGAALALLRPIRRDEGGGLRRGSVDTGAPAHHVLPKQGSSRGRWCVDHQTDGAVARKNRFEGDHAHPRVHGYAGRGADPARDHPPPDIRPPHPKRIGFHPAVHRSLAEGLAQA